MSSGSIRRIVRCQQHWVVGSRPRAEATDGVAVEARTIALNGGTIMVRPTLVSAETTEGRHAGPRDVQRGPVVDR